MYRLFDILRLFTYIMRNCIYMLVAGVSNNYFIFMSNYIVYSIAINKKEIKKQKKVKSKYHKVFMYVLKNYIHS